MTLVHLVFPVAAALLLALVTAVLRRRPIGRLEITLALAIAVLIIEAVAGYVLVGWTESAADRSIWLRIVMTCGLLVAPVWAAFLAGLVTSGSTATNRAARLVVGGISAATCVATALVWLGEPFVISDLPGRFYAA